jgi:hypothetical protein
MTREVGQANFGLPNLPRDYQPIRTQEEALPVLRRNGGLVQARAEMLALTNTFLSSKAAVGGYSCP